MDQEQRSAQRCSLKEIPVLLYLRDESTSTILAGPSRTTINNLSSHGAGLVLKQITINSHHLFYSPNDKDNFQLYLEQENATDSEEDHKSIPVQPVWFRLDDNDSIKKFHLGVKFMIGPEDPRIINLKKMAMKQLSPGQGWFGKMLLKFMG